NPGDEHMAVGIDGDRGPDLVLGLVAEPEAPDVVAVPVELHDEDVLLPCARRERVLRIEGDDAVEAAGQEHAALGVHRDRAPPLLAGGATERPLPDAAAASIELHHEHVVAAAALRRAAPEIDRAREATGHDDAAVRERGRAHRVLVFLVAGLEAPEVLSPRVVARDEDVRAPGDQRVLAVEGGRTPELPG